MNWKYNSDQKMEIKVHLKIGKNIQLENGNKSPCMNWKYNSDQKMKIIVHLKIREKVRLGKWK